ncbi:MAG: TetR/AcrR family transcriptional regulator [Candidatus Marinimicrobia bacterium]|nr:TetR/AcrR family transcriptional regulator [Candidatus Neomarinimicrobiota bacterium]
MLKQALILFNTYGYENVGIQKIIDSVGVKKPTLYHYFGSKNGLLKHLLDENFGNLIKSLKEHASYQGHLLNTLEETVKVHFSFAKTYKEFYSLHLNMLSASVKSEIFQTAKVHIDWLYDSLTQIFIDAVPEHGNLRNKDRQLAITFYGMIHSYIQMYLHDEISLDGDAYFLVTKQFMYGIFA